MLIIVGIVLLFIMDLVIKRWANNRLKDGNNIDTLNGNVRFNLLYNEGAAMGFLGNKKKALNAVTVAAVMMVIALIPDIIKKGTIIDKIGITIATAGALNNSYERIAKGQVTDYISFPKFPIDKIKKIVFNISDFLIMIGAVMLLIGGLFKHK
jgi:lipoprotein signal peptidase